jgi:hypothetical protein
MDSTVAGVKLKVTAVRGGLRKFRPVMVMSAPGWARLVEMAVN